jgi:D-aspartate ligase
VSLPRGTRTAEPAPGSSEKPIPILILGLAGLSMHHGALGAMRSAGRLGIPVFHAQVDRRSPIDRSRYSRGGLVLPPDGAGDRTLAVLTEFAAGHGPCILLAVDDASAMFVADHSDELRETFLFPRQPGGLARALADKRAMHGLCREYGIPTPLAAFPDSEADVRAHATEATFPVVAKRIDVSQPPTSATPNVLVAQDRDELLAAYRSMESPRRSNVMLQEYIPGATDANWMFNGYFDSRSECGLSFTARKLRQSPPDGGATTLGECLTNPSLRETTRRFMKAVGYRGILDADYRLDQRDGQYKLLDVNPRIGSSFRLFVTADGTDVLRAMYLDLAGGPGPMPNAVPIAPPDAIAEVDRDADRATPTIAATTAAVAVNTATVAAVSGRRWLVEPQDLRSCMIHIKRGDLTVGAWLRSLRHIDETAWWAREDPRPFFAMVRSLLAARMRKRPDVRNPRARVVSGAPER